MIDDLRCEAAKLLVIGSTRPIIDRHVPTVGPARLLKRLPKSHDLHTPIGILLVVIVQQTNSPNSFALLRACSERPCCHRATDHRDELAPLQPIEMHSLPFFQSDKIAD